MLSFAFPGGKAKLVTVHFREQSAVKPPMDPAGQEMSASTIPRHEPPSDSSHNLDSQSKIGLGTDFGFTRLYCLLVGC